MTRRAWDAWEVALLRQSYATYRTGVIAQVLGRRESNVYQKATKLGLKKDRECVRQWSREAMADPNHGGHRSRFVQGQEPANKGKKHPPGWSPGRMSQTQFKRGNKPVTWLPVGTYRVNDGMLERKVNDLPGPPNVRWHAVSRIVWEEAHGPVPKGHVVVFKPGRQTTELEDITLDAVELITRRELMRRNSVHTVYPPELARTVQLRGVLTRAINHRSKEADS
jgi:hypothetical protein